MPSYKLGDLVLLAVVKLNQASGIKQAKPPVVPKGAVS
jgi:hypothetical protein